MRAVKEDPDRNAKRVAMGVATGWVILRHRPYRRNLLFATTLLTLVLVFVGAVPLGVLLSDTPLGFALFWLAVFLLVAFILLLAIYDLIQVRREHNRRLQSLEKELAEAAEEARRLARENAEGEPGADED